MRSLPLAAFTVTLLLAGCSSDDPLAETTDTNTIETTTTSATVETSPSTAPVDAVEGRYFEHVFSDVTVSTDEVYATAPDLVSGADVTLHLDVYQPVDDTLASRPTIVWVHGGGFKAGSKEILREVATEWARRGYVTVSVEYRLDRGNRCQDVQDLKIADGEVEVERLRCAAAIDAAQHDTQAAIRWLRANASEFGIDAERIAIGGFSAGAVTAVNVATQADDPGDVGEHLDQPSDVSAALVASGCSFMPEEITAGDAPMYLLASENDQAVPFTCTQATEGLALAQGIIVETSYHLGEGTHAKALYGKYQAEVDPEWAEFLVIHLGLS
ncbi:MAG: alpha/beta hydrolase fold domain-containing protein [Actinomycetota bacterium]|nr:alpha/beta hydrolase fold domain-containing protein [Actinomycetota bacterium]